MKKRTLWFAPLMITILVLPGCGNASSQTQDSQGMQGMQMTNTTNSTAKVPANAQLVHVVASDYQWQLDKDQFVHNKPITFDLTCLQGDHGFSIDGTKISQPISSGQEAYVTWTPPKAGTYVIRCNKICGDGHDNMVTKFTVR